MSTEQNTRIGIVGVGGIGTNVHIPGLQAVERCKITAICDSNKERLQIVGDQLQLPQSRRFCDYHDLIACADVDAVEVCTPNDQHAPIAIATLAAGKPVNIEKPVALNLAQANEMLQAQKAAGLPAMVCFSYRFMPAVRYAYELLRQGALGQLLSVNVAYLKDSGLIPGRKMEWRFQKEHAGTGVLGDLGAHLVDMTRLLIGEFQAVCGAAGVVVKQRPWPDREGMGTVDTDDYCMFMAKLQGDVNGLFTITRCAPGHSNTILFDVYGTRGTLSFNLNQPEKLGMGGKELCPDEPKLHFVDVPARYHAAQEQTFVNAVRGELGSLLPTLEDGVRCQQVLDAVLQSSAENRWVQW
ncbi:MAG: Gfo/Idh/MocA family oxidoreductase [Eubacteriales bacterium]|nr:Gfo/Idh/MocA family oxidoreductase [Eubacteriales bacterium]